MALLLAGLVACVAWYRLSDHHAPFANSASVIADNAQVQAGRTLFQIDPTTYQMDVEQARAQLAQVLNTVGASFAAIPAAQAKLEQAKLAFAPADGYVSNLALSDGPFVGAGTTAMTFINPATPMVIADFRENQLINVPGDRAIGTFEAAPGKQFEGKVDSVACGINSGGTSVNGLS